MNRKFKMTLTITVNDNSKALEEILEMKNEVLSGEMQKVFLEDTKEQGAVDIKATFEEIN